MMKKALLIITFSALWGSLAFAAGDADAGSQKVATCAACHGADGNSAAPSFPNLAGQGYNYLYKQLVDIQQGNRVVLTMTGLLDDSSDQDLKDMAAFYAKQTPKVGQADPELAALGERIYRAGIAASGVPSCASCHSPTGQGNNPALYPMLSGQHAEYTALQLHKFQRGYRHEGEPVDEVRVNDGDAMIMRSIADRLKAHEIEALAAYIQGLY